MNYADDQMAKMKKKKTILFTVGKPILNHGKSTTEIQNESYSKLDESQENY